MSLLKDKTFLSIYIPNYLEYSVLFILGILDTIFIAFVDPHFVTVLGVTHSLLIVVFVTSQIIANITSAHLANPDLTDDKRYFWINKTLLLTFLTGVVYVGFILVLVPYLLQAVNLDNHYQHLNYSFIVLILLGAIFVALRRGISAVFNIYRQAKINLYSSFLIVILNVVLNIICYWSFYGKNNDFYLLGIATATLLSQVLVPLGLLYWMIKHKVTDFSNIKKLITTLRQDWGIIKTGFVGSLEAGSYTVMTYVFIAILSHISQTAYLTRTMLVPWFQMVGALAAAWVGYTNRELAFCLNKNLMIKFGRMINYLIKWGRLFTSIGLVVMLSIFAIYQHWALKNIYHDDQAISTLIIVVLSMALIELFRVQNVITLTGLRLLKRVGQSTTLSIVCHIVLVTGYGVIYYTQAYISTLLAVGLMFGLMIGDEYFRSVYNYSLVKKYSQPNTVIN